MDRRRFLDTAPAYYGLAIVAYLAEAGERLAYRSGIQSNYSVEYEEGVVDHLDLDDLFAAGAKHIVGLGLIEIIKDDFGPDLYKLADEFLNRWSALQEDKGSLYYKYAAAGDTKRQWLLSALRSVKQRYEELGITTEDFGDNAPDWAPIPLERDDEGLQALIGEIDKVAEQVRGDNGYGTQHGEEKTYVLEKLRSVSKRLKEDTTISWLYLREFAIEPLLILGRRFGKAAIGIAAEAAKAVLKEWLKKKGITFLDNI